MESPEPTASEETNKAAVASIHQPGDGRNEEHQRGFGKDAGAGLDDREFGKSGEMGWSEGPGHLHLDFFNRR